MKRKSQRQQAAIRLLAEGRTERETAECLGIAERIIQGWNEDAGFAAAVEICHEAMLRRARNRAVCVFLQQMDSENDTLRQNAAVRALAQYNSAAGRQREPDIRFTFANAAAPGMPQGAQALKPQGEVREHGGSRD